MRIVHATSVVLSAMALFAAGPLQAADGNLRDRSIAERDREVKEEKETQNRELVHKKMKSAETFIATAGKMVVDGSDRRAVELLNNARLMKAGADDYVKEEDYVRASKKLDASINSALQAIAIVVKGESVRDKAVRELEREYAERKKRLYMEMIAKKRTESEVFIETAKRLLKEKENREAADILKGSIERKEAAEGYAAAGELEKAVEFLNESFSLAVNAVRAMRDDQVVVRRMNFKNAEEEFNYEKENNETYLMMALPVVKGGTEGARQRINEARDLRKRSEGTAALRNYSGALRDIRSSNSLLITTIEGFDAKAGNRR